jgi:hypothetical protein
MWYHGGFRIILFCPEVESEDVRKGRYFHFGKTD